MEAARRLRKSYNNSYDVDKRNLKFQDNPNIKEINKIKLDYKKKILIRIFLCCLILLISVISKYLYKEEVNNIKYINTIIVNYNKDYNKINILESLEEKFKSFENVTKGFIPDKIKLVIVNSYINHIKPYIIDFDFKKNINSFVYSNNDNVNIYPIDIYQEVDVYKQVEIYETNINKEKFDGVGGKEFEIEEINNLSEKEIDKDTTSFILPTKGVVTSRFGKREEVLPGSGNFHFGIDIANNKGTYIISSISGVVTNIVFFDKYLGNYIDISNNEFTTRYAHLDKVLVNINENINQGKIIGEMGNTGLSTGPHLHFEVIYNGNHINPEDVLEF